MKKTGLFIMLLVSVTCLIPPACLGQSLDPPDCCKGPHSIVPGVPPASTNAVLSQLYASDRSIRLLGLNRAQFIDRMSEVFFPGAQVDVVITSTRMASTRSVRDQKTERMLDISTVFEEGLLAVQEKRVYQIPRYRLSPEYLETLDQVVITDGRASIRITFVREGLLDS